MTIERYLEARKALIRKDLIAFDGTRFHVLSLPARPLSPTPPALQTDEDFEADDPATVRHLIQSTFGSHPSKR